MDVCAHLLARLGRAKDAHDGQLGPLVAVDIAHVIAQLRIVPGRRRLVVVDAVEAHAKGTHRVRWRWLLGERRRGRRRDITCGLVVYVRAACASPSGRGAAARWENRLVWSRYGPGVGPVWHGEPGDKWLRCGPVGHTELTAESCPGLFFRPRRGCRVRIRLKICRDFDGNAFLKRDQVWDRKDAEWGGHGTMLCWQKRSIVSVGRREPRVPIGLCLFVQLERGVGKTLRAFKISDAMLEEPNSIRILRRARFAREHVGRS